MLVTVLLLGLALPFVASIPFAFGPRAAPWLAGFFRLWFLFAILICWPGVSLPVYLGPVCFFIPILIGSLALCSPFAGKLRRSFPTHLPIYWQTARIVGGLFFVPATLGTLAWDFAGPAGTGDVLIGLTAPFVATAYRPRPNRGLALGLAWNILGLLDFAIAIVSAIITNSRLEFPLRLIPAYFVPFAILVHFFSMGNLLAQSQVTHDNPIPSPPK